MFEKPIAALGKDFEESLAALKAEIASASSRMTEAALILNETVLVFCLKKILDSSADSADKAKRRTLLINKLAEIHSGKFGMMSTMLHPCIMAQCDRVKTLALAGSSK